VFQMHDYDGLGNRYASDIRGQQHTYLNDLQPGLTKLLRHDDGSDTYHHIHGPRGVHARYDGTDWQYYLEDGLRSVRGLVGNDLEVDKTYDYDPYGKATPAISGFAFTGEWRDDAVWQFHRARYYWHEKGTWLSLDPFEGVMDRPMSLNGYSWVEGNTPNMVDPTGMTTCRTDCWNKHNMSATDYGYPDPTGYGNCIQSCPDEPFQSLWPSIILPDINQILGGCPNDSTLLLLLGAVARGGSRAPGWGWVAAAVSLAVLASAGATTLPRTPSFDFNFSLETGDDAIPIPIPIPRDLPRPTDTPDDCRPRGQFIAGTNNILLDGVTIPDGIVATLMYATEVVDKWMGCPPWR